MFAGLMLLVLPLSLVLATPRGRARRRRARGRSRCKQALVEAFGHRSYVLLVLGFFTCGFQLAFVTVHLPSYLVDRGLARRRRRLDHRASSACSTSSARCVGLARRRRMPKRYILSVIYFGRALAIVGLHHAAGEHRPSTLIFGAVTGLLWLSTVPPTSGLVALMFGTRWLTMLFGFAFFSHQVGGFLGVWLGGLLFEQHRLLRHGVVAVGVLRRRLGADQPADRRKAGARGPARPPA